MGLDAVELLIAFEEEFEISISDEDAQAMTTPDQVTDYLFMRQHGQNQQMSSPSYPCMSQQMFHQLRTVFMQEFGIERHRIRPQSSVRNLLGHDIRAQWKRLDLAIGGGGLPGLDCSRPIKGFIASVFPIILIWLLMAGAHPVLAAVLALVSWGIAWVIATEKLADQIPQSLATIGNIVPYVVQPDKLNWSRQQILHRVIVITSRQLGIPIEKIRPDHHFVKDLGMD